jgi:hypothetical protein
MAPVTLGGVEAAQQCALDCAGKERGVQRRAPLFGLRGIELFNLPAGHKRSLERGQLCRQRQHRLRLSRRRVEHAGAIAAVRAFDE